MYSGLLARTDKEKEMENPQLFFQVFGTEKSDEKNAVFDVEGFLLVNNQHGRHRLVEGDTYTQTVACVDGGKFPAGWKWDLETSQPGVKGYPQLQLGHNPHTGRVAGDSLPLRLCDLGSLIAFHDASMVGEGKHALVFDLWVTSTETPTEETITHEIMVWLVDNTGVISPQTPPFTNETFGWHKWDVCKGEWHDYPSWMFVPETPNPVGWTNLGEMIKYLIEDQHISPCDFLASVTIGTEMHNGSGAAVLDKYSVLLTKA